MEEPNTRICEKCGFQASIKDNFCEQCGNNFNNIPAARAIPAREDICVHCGKTLDGDYVYCPYCNVYLYAAEKEIGQQPLDLRILRSANRAKGHIKTAQTTIIIVAIIILLSAVALISMIDKIRYTGSRNSSHMMNLAVAGVFLTSIIFFILAYWINTRPLLATTSALILFTTFYMVVIIVNPQHILSVTSIINLIIINFLIKGVKAGVAKQITMKESGYDIR